ncbi:hypothetical protein N5915_06560 [Arcobacter lacus]|uniref:hypothetical protein n=1 Tax=Arcobacter lacus TaxID=1912876 RepID=UPI0021BAA21C|nr:hypothetical protein [Arcobacter lacus]MCT7909219.1 hypothetical protein [Arcobacter lacus]
MKSDIDVVYSPVTIQEIGQIKNDENFAKHFAEHYCVLEQLEAKFIDPLSKKLIDEKPHKVALNYLNNKKNLSHSPYSYLEKVWDDFNRKVSGLNVDKSFDDISEKMKMFLTDILSDNISKIDNLNDEDYEEPMRSIIINMKKDISQVLKKSLPISNIFNQVSISAYSINQYRKDERTKKVMDSNPTRSELIMELKRRWKNESHFFEQTPFNNLIESKIFYAYTQLNWLGYYPDDFTKVKKNNDRFNASQNDMKHASFAYISTFLISNDTKFCEKTILSYEFANVKTIVCSYETFLEEYFLLLGGKK